MTLLYKEKFIWADNNSLKHSFTIVKQYNVYECSVILGLYKLLMYEILFRFLIIWFYFEADNSN